MFLGHTFPRGLVIQSSPPVNVGSAVEMRVEGVEVVVPAVGHGRESGERGTEWLWPCAVADPAAVRLLGDEQPRVDQLDQVFWPPLGG